MTTWTVTSATSGQTVIKNSANQLIETDVTIIGGGIAGLWLLNRLLSEGYKALLFEHRALGSNQTVASQGMIHGGIKYTLAGALSGASEAIAAMPEYWRNCLHGAGEVDLSRAKLLSDHFYMWSASSATAKLTTFFASKATRGRVDRVKKSALPPLLQNDKFNGVVYKLADIVVDVPSVLQALAEQVAEHIYLIDENKTHLVTDRQDNSTSVQINAGDSNLQIKNSALVFTAGQGNEALLTEVGATAPTMQRRRLHQVMVKHHYPHQFYGHCLGTDITPRLTISSHPCIDGTQVWYLGGGLAEKGINLSSGELIDRARRELTELLPWVNLDKAQWATLAIDRAEPEQLNLTRPDQAYVNWAQGCSNVITAWPTKLTLAPNLASETLMLLRKRAIMPGSKPLPKLSLPRPSIALSPWQLAFGA